MEEYFGDDLTVEVSVLINSGRYSAARDVYKFTMPMGFVYDNAAKVTVAFRKSRKFDYKGYGDPESLRQVAAIGAGIHMGDTLDNSDGFAQRSLMIDLLGTQTSFKDARIISSIFEKIHGIGSGVPKNIFLYSALSLLHKAHHKRLGNVAQYPEFREPKQKFRVPRF